MNILTMPDVLIDDYSDHYRMRGVTHDGRSWMSNNLQFAGSAHTPDNLKYVQIGVLPESIDRMVTNMENDGLRVRFTTSRSRQPSPFRRLSV